MILKKWESRHPKDTVWVRCDEEGQVRVQITYHDKVGGVTDFFFPPEEQPPALRISHGSSISVQMMYADDSLKRAGCGLIGNWHDTSEGQK